MEWKNIIIVFLGALIQGVISIKLLNLRVPSHAIRDQSVRLECSFDLDGETLYSVKWYKDGNEFYRFVPKNMPSSQVFPLPGVKVDIHNSTENSVVLSSVQLSSTGFYRCEVSGEAPSFETVTDHARMIVVALPETGPKISGGKSRYQVGDTVSVNCTSGRSKPAAHLRWLINDEPANPKYVHGPEIVITGREGLETTILGLEFVAKPKHFRRSGNMKLKCSATIATVWQVSNEESVEGEKAQRTIVLESRGTISPFASSPHRVPTSSSISSTASLTVTLAEVLTLTCVYLVAFK